jgi:hypothetical protein
VRIGFSVGISRLAATPVATNASAITAKMVKANRELRCKTRNIYSSLSEHLKATMKEEL